MFVRFFCFFLLSVLLCGDIQAAPGDDPPLDRLIFLPGVAAPPSQVLIAAAHIDSAISGEADEALLLWNTGHRVERLAGWRLTGGGRTATFPVTSTLTLSPGERLWCANQSAAFRLSFGHDPACAWGENSDPAILELAGSVALGNTGGSVQLWRPGGGLADTLVYGQFSSPAQGWIGLPAQVYSRGSIPAEGQVWQRKRDGASGLPVDTDRATDWASDLGDLAWGRQARFPGWLGWTDAELGKPSSGSDEARVTVAVGPEGLYAPIAGAFASALVAVDLSAYTFEHPDLAQILAGAARRGVRVRLLLEGGPAGGISHEQRWCIALMAEAGVQVRYMAAQPEAPTGYRPRYRFQHAKYAVIDQGTAQAHALVGTDNFGMDSMPLPSADASARHPQGRRGAFLFTDAPGVVTGLAHIFQADWAPERFLDLMPFTPGDPTYGGPPPDFLPAPATLYMPVGSPFFQPVSSAGRLNWILISAPENATRPDSGLLALLAQAGPGDEIRMAQLYEHKFWGETSSNPIADPNLRLEAVIEAARRGASVRLLLDSYFDSAASLRSNRATAAYLHSLAAAEGLDIQARVGNPTGLGIHAKLVLLRIGGAHWVGVGSINGSEISHKLNREILLMVDAPTIYHRLLDVFTWDWASVP